MNCSCVHANRMSSAFPLVTVSSTARMFLMSSIVMSFMFNLLVVPGGAFGTHNSGNVKANTKNRPERGEICCFGHKTQIIDPNGAKLP